MKVVFTPVTIEARVFEDGKEYGEEYVSGFNLHVCGSLAFVSLLRKENDVTCYVWTLDIDKQMKKYLKSIGVKRLSYECKGKIIDRNLEDMDDLQRYRK